MKPTLYEKDFFKWARHQAFLLETKKFDKLDLKNLVEEINDLGSSFKDALESHLIIALMHMLKKQLQSEKNSKSWQDSIVNARTQIFIIQEKYPSLKNYLSTVLGKCYIKARRYASKETGINLKKFPADCPWTIEEILN